MRAAAPIRTIHHFACTGGTLITRHLAALPGLRVISEVDPLSTHGVYKKFPAFAPTDLIRMLRQSDPSVSDATILRVFIAGLRALYDDCSDHGQHLLLRDHSHSQFCTDQDYTARPTLLEILRPHFPIVSVVSVRHPLDSYLSLQANNWVSFAPPTLDEYCKRYRAFLDAHDGLASVRYEDFVGASEDGLASICTILNLPFDSGVLEKAATIHLSGNSGRKGGAIKQRERRQVPDLISKETQSSPNYLELCHTMGYTL